MARFGEPWRPLRRPVKSTGDGTTGSGPGPRRWRTVRSPGFVEGNRRLLAPQPEDRAAVGTSRRLAGPPSCARQAGERLRLSPRAGWVVVRAPRPARIG